MGYPDGKFYGFGHAYCVTDNLLQGDIIRVQSVTVPTRVYNATVQTVGEIIHFDKIEPYDRYKISHIREVEVGGVTTEVEMSSTYKDFSYGSTYYIDLFNKTTMAGLQGILNGHAGSSRLNIGDEITIKVSGADTILQILAFNIYQSNDLILGCKNLWTTSIWHSNNSQIRPYGDSELKTTLEGFYTAMEETDKQYVKTKAKKSYTSNTGWYSYEAKVWTPNFTEITGSQISVTYEDTQTQFPIFTTTSNRIKYLNGVANAWATSDGNGPGAGNPGTRRIIGSDGSNGTTWYNSAVGVLPCFYMTADS